MEKNIYNRAVTALSRIDFVPGYGRAANFMRKFAPAIPEGTVLSRRDMKWNMWFADDHVSRELFYFSSYERASTRLVKRHLSPGMNCLDIGANCGYFTVLFGLGVKPSGMVFSFEPSPNFSRRLKLNVDLNGLSNVKIVNVAISDQIGKLVLNEVGCNAIGYEGILEASKSEERAFKHEVPVSTVDIELKKIGSPKIDFIKIDIEGFEGKCIAGGMDTISKNKPFILFEYNYELLDMVSTTNLDVILAPLAKLNYRYQRDDTLEVFSSISNLAKSVSSNLKKCNILCMPC